MGWDTQINIIVENIVNEEIEITEHLFESDAKNYFQNGISFIKFRALENGFKVLFFTYERRKYLPYWVIQEVSKKFSNNYFTVVGSSPDFLCGPAGIVKIVNGEIIDSYGFTERFGDRSVTLQVLETPIPEVLFQCFGKNKLEELVRGKYIENHPKKWIDEKYSENILAFKAEENEQFKILLETSKDEFNHWYEIAPPIKNEG